MAFWEKSEDPWDMDPEKRKRAQTTFYEEEASAEEKTEWKLPWKKEKAEIVEEPPMVCPWCGETMTKGYLTSGRDAVVWGEQKPTALLGMAFIDTVTISNEGFMPSYKTCWHCKPCRKLVVDVPEPPKPSYVWEGGEPKQLEEEENDDL